MNSENPSRPKRWRHGILGWLEKLHGIIVRKDSIETTGFAPVIRQFTASSEDADGQPITLSWEVENTTRLLLNDQDVTGQSTALVNPRSDTEYILHAFNELDNELGEKSYQILIRVNKTPIFINFF